MGTRARGGITLHNVKNGADAEYYRLQPQSEKAVVGTDNALYVTLSYIIEHAKGAQVTTEAGSAQGYHVTARMNNGVTISMTNGAVNSGTYKLTNYSKAQNRPDYLIIELKDKANKVVDTRTVQIIMESSSYVDVVGDLRTTVSQQGENITTIKQTADSISLKVDGIKNGVKNLLKGGKYEKTFSSYGFTKEAKVIKLKPQTTYTLTMCGHISADAITKKQTLQGYVVSDGWKFSAGGANLEINTPTDSVVSFTFTTPTADKLPNGGLCFFDAFPTPNKEPQARNAEVTVNWVTVTEGTQAAASWIPADGETGEDKAKEVELRLENGEFKVKSNKTVFVDGSGKETVLIKDGKLSAELIDAVKIVAAGIQAQTIDAKNAIFKNITVEGDSTFKGDLDGVEGSFKRLNCMSYDGKDIVGGITFDGSGRMMFTGDLVFQGLKTVNGIQRKTRLLSNDLWVRGQFGHNARICAVIQDEYMYVHHTGHIDSKGIKIKLGVVSFPSRANPNVNASAYKIPLYSPGRQGILGEDGTLVDVDNPNINNPTDPIGAEEMNPALEIPNGASIDMVIFNCTRSGVYVFDKKSIGYGKAWTVFNGNNNVGVSTVTQEGVITLGGGEVREFTYVNPEWLTPKITDVGGGIITSSGRDMNW
ncbi:hypothetical protein [Prevotella histicola]|uniref:hypothetical protein n=1 Tax=Prevotella histicola TaxID=470565 RepID=UPI0028EFE768|nr:hypothetical protein [Prevotella histicola]